MNSLDDKNIVSSGLLCSTETGTDSVKSQERLRSGASDILEEAESWNWFT